MSKKLGSLESKLKRLGKGALVGGGPKKRKLLKGPGTGSCVVQVSSPDAYFSGSCCLYLLLLGDALEGEGRLVGGRC
jgi:hypothetical protein